MKTIFSFKFRVSKWKIEIKAVEYYLTNSNCNIFLLYWSIENPEKFDWSLDYIMASYSFEFKSKRLFDYEKHKQWVNEAWQPQDYSYLPPWLLHFTDF